MSTRNIVCLPGLGRSSSDWERVRGALERFGKVVALDLPCHPGDALEQVRRETPDYSIVIGHSHGAILALQLAASGRSLAGVVLSSSFFPPARNGRSWLVSLADYSAHRLAFLRETKSPSPAVATVGVRRSEGLRELVRIALNRSAFTAMTNAVTAPALVVHAENDHYVPIDFARAAVKLHPAWQFAALTVGGHYPHRDAPREWLEPVSSWIEGLEAMR